MSRRPRACGSCAWLTAEPHHVVACIVKGSPARCGCAVRVNRDLRGFGICVGGNGAVGMAVVCRLWGCSCPDWITGAAWGLPLWGRRETARAVQEQEAYCGLDAVRARWADGCDAEERLVLSDKNKKNEPPPVSRAWPGHDPRWSESPSARLSIHVRSKHG